MNWMDFALRLLAALVFGALIGLEQQWRQRMTGLRTNGLVAVGSAMFVVMGGLIAGDGSQGRVAAYDRFRCTCRSADEAHMRALLLQNVQPTPLALIALHSMDLEGVDRIEVTAQLKSLGRKDAFLEQIVTRLSLEASVSAISWELVGAVDTEDVSVGSDEMVRTKMV